MAINNTHTTINYHVMGYVVSGVTPRWVVLHACGEVYNARFTYATEAEAEARAYSACQYGASNRVELRLVPYSASRTTGVISFRPDPECGPADYRLAA